MNRPWNNGDYPNHTCRKALFVGDSLKLEKNTHMTVTIVCPFFQPIFRASLMHATRLHALLDPRNRPSCCTRYRDMLTASASVILSYKIQFHCGFNNAVATYRNTSSMIGKASSILFVTLLMPLHGKKSGCVRILVNFAQRYRLTFLPRRCQPGAVSLSLRFLCGRT